MTGNGARPVGAREQLLRESRPPRAAVHGLHGDLVRISPVYAEHGVMAEMEVAIATEIVEQRGRNAKRRDTIVDGTAAKQVLMAGVVQQIAERALPVRDDENGER